MEHTEQQGTSNRNLNKVQLQVQVSILYQLLIALIVTHLFITKVILIGDY